ncbi:MAG: glycerophosphodiester phosphodiesterase [Bacteroidales bacterium]|nr:glycerophosphodiester phosphodiesterase [Bacteroidales bacterium]
MSAMRRLLTYCVAALLGAATLSAQPRILAHRGGRAEQEENVLAAFQATYEAGCHAFETDIHITADGQYVIMHDHTLERLTDGQGRIEQTQSAYIRTLKTKEGHPVLFLDELLDYFKGCKTLYVEWEMKTNERDYPTALLHKYCDEVYAKVMAAKPADALYVFSSFDPRALIYIQQRHPEAEVMLITGKPCTQETVDLVKALGLHRVAATLGGTSRSGVKYAHDKGVQVNLWPGEKPADTHLAFLLGADYLCTDIPQEVIRYIDEQQLGIRYQ